MSLWDGEKVDVKELESLFDEYRQKLAVWEGYDPGVEFGFIVLDLKDNPISYRSWKDAKLDAKLDVMKKILRLNSVWSDAIVEGVPSILLVEAAFDLGVALAISEGREAFDRGKKKGREPKVSIETLRREAKKLIDQKVVGANNICQ